MQGANPFIYPAPGISSNDIASGITPSTAFAASGSRSSRPPQQYGQDLKNKKRKIDRACDACRRKKTKCDGPKLPNNVCTNCIQNSRTCTYVESSRPRGPSKAYVTGLEDRLEKMEALLKRLRPESDFSDVLGPAVIRGSWKSADEQSPPSRSTSLQAISLSPPTTSPLTQAGSYASCVPTLSAQTSYRPAQILPDDQSSSWSSLSSPRPAPSALGLSTHLLFKSPTHPKRTRLKLSSSTKTQTPLTAQNESSASSSPSSSPSSSDTDELVESFSGGMQRLTLRGIGSATGEDAGQTRFHGKSSSMTLVQATRAFKEQHMLSMNRGAGGGEDVQMRSRGLREDNTIGDTGVRQTKVVGHSMRRQEYWRTPQWELVWEGLHVDSPELVPSVLTHFPPPDLCAKLIEIYFTHTNTQFPLLHKPTFDRQCSEPEPLYKKDVWFAAVCLGVFAVASRWCDDERVLLDEGRGKAGGVVDWTTAGWRYFNVVVAIHRMRRSLIHPACLCEVQTFTLMGMFLRGTASHPVGWFIVGVGIRKAQDVGAHRKNVYNNKPSVDEELWKRAWWCLVAFDRVGSTSLGRPCGVGEEDFDVDLPLAVDDEYWETEDPALAFRQPPGKPDLVTAFNLWVRLTQICAFAIRTILMMDLKYAVDKSKVLGRIATEWPEEVLAQLNTAMTEWLDGVPEHLKWSNNMENHVFANQSATIYTAYYLTQILIHRPFIRPPSHPLPNDGLQGHAHTTDETLCPALDVCTNAAKSCARIVEKQLQRGLSNIPNLISVAHICAAILLVNVWNLKAEEKAKSAEDVKPPLAQTIEVLMNDVYIFMRALEGVGSRWESGTVYLQRLRDSLPSADDDSVSASVQPTSNFDHPHQPTGVDRISVPEPSVLDPIFMASSHLFPLETPSSRHRSQSQDTDDWRGQSDFLQPHTSYVGPSNTESRHRPPHQTDPNSSIALKQEFSQRPSYPDGHQNMYNHIRQPHVSFSSHENSNWPPLSQSSSSQPSHSDRSRIRPSSVSSIPRFFSTELPPPSISAMRRMSFSGGNQDGERGGQSYERYSNTRSLVKPENTNLNYGDEVDGRSVYYRPPPDVAIRSQLQPQSPWDKNNYRTSDWGNHQHAAPTVEHSDDLVTWSATSDRYPQTTSDIRGVQLDRDPHETPYSGVYSI